MIVELGRLQRMIDNILDTSRFSAAETLTSPERLVLADEVADAVVELREYALECDVVFAVDTPDTLIVRADKDGMRTVLRNLLHNAIKASPIGGAVHIQATGDSEGVRFAISDSGVGFSAAEAGRLFDKFYKVDGEGRGRTHGSGLGLFLVRRLVELDGGSVSAASEGVGHGAVFSVTWPVPGESRT